MEKAFAKINGNYSSIIGGWPSLAGYHFLGISGSDIDCSSTSADQMWAQIVDWDQKKYIMSAGSIGNAMGIVGGHAYTVISAHVLKTNGKRLLKLRNPWGKTEWSGAYKDSDAFWTSATTAAEDKALIVNKDDGIFFMTIEDFKAYFFALTANPDTSKW